MRTGALKLVGIVRHAGQRTQPGYTHSIATSRHCNAARQQIRLRQLSLNKHRVCQTDANHVAMTQLWCPGFVLTIGQVEACNFRLNFLKG